MTFTSRRNLAGLTCAAAAGLALLADFALRLRLRRADLVSGGALLAVVLVLNALVALLQRLGYGTALRPGALA